MKWLTRIMLAIAFGSKHLAVILLACVPMIELKGAIPIGVKLGLNLWPSFWLAFLGSSLVAVLLLLFLAPLFKWAKKNKKISNFFTRIENVFRKKAGKLIDKSATLEEDGTSQKKLTLLKMLGLFVFVAVPLPLTGVWTGSMVAVLLGMNFFLALPTIVLGNLVAGLLILLLTMLLGKYVDLFLYILFAVVFILFVLFLIKIFKKEKQEAKTEENEAK